MDYKKIPIGKDAPEIVNSVIEIPRDTNQKYEYDLEIQAFLGQNIKVSNAISCKLWFYSINSRRRW